MKTIFLNHPATPQEALEFTQHLLDTFPLTRAHQICIEFSPKNSIGKNAWGRAKNWNYTCFCIHLEIALGFSKERRPLDKLLHTVAHEYCHALQYDQEKPACCVEADKFGDRESKKYLKAVEKRYSGSKKAA